MRNIIFFSWVGYLWFLFACPCFGQAGKPVGAVFGDLDAIGDILPIELSPNGEWVAYNVVYPTGMDTLFVQNIESGKRHVLPLATRPEFIGESGFIAYTPSNELMLYDLRTTKKTYWKDAYHIKASSEKAILVVGEQNAQKEVKVSSLAGETLLQFTGVSSFSYNPTADALAMIVKKQDSQLLKIIWLDHRLPDFVLPLSKSDITYLTWQDKGETIGFVQTENDKVSVRTIDVRSKKDEILEVSTQPMLQDYTLGGNALRFSENGSTVYLSFKGKPKIEKTEPCEIWNSLDRELYSHRKKYPNPKLRVARWEQVSGKISWISSPRHTFTQLLPGDAFALCSQPSASDTRDGAYGLRDFEIIDLATNKTTPFLQEFMPFEQLRSVSPAGTSIAFFEKGDWYFTDLKTMRVSNLTGTIVGHTFGADRPAYLIEGIAGWLNDTTVLAYDRFDIWALSPHKATRLTTGAQIGKKFSVYGNRDSSSLRFDLTNGILLSSQTEKKSTTGLYMLSTDGARKLVDKPKRIWSAKRGVKNVVYIEEDYYEPRAIYAISKNRKPKLLCQSSPQLLKRKGPSSKLVRYTLPSGRQMDGALYFPHDYDASKSYPMIVFIYEMLSEQNHMYFPPTPYETEGFSRPLFTGEGYFVFCPDIEYEIGRLGESATTSVTTAVHQVLVDYPVDPKRIGLVGHSFGGYESSFIITRTDMFAAAIAGAGITDLASLYLSEKLSYAEDHFDYVVNDQIRMGKGLFEDWKNYLQNSPIYGAGQVSTPLLSWTGTNDTQVPPNQTVEYYFALRKFGKRSVMLKYPGENHILHNRESQKDLFLRFRDWFGHYLKGEPMQDWMQPK